MLMLYDPCKGSFPIGIIYHRIALVIPDRKQLGLKPEGTVFQLSLTVVKELIYGSGIYYPVRKSGKLLSLLKEITAAHDVTALKELFDHHVIAPYGYALEAVVEIVVVIGISYRQPLYDKCGKIPAVPSPLLFRISLDKLFVYILSHKAYGLLLKIGRLL